MKTRHNPSETPVSSRGHLDGFGYFGQQWLQIVTAAFLISVQFVVADEMPHPDKKLGSQIITGRLFSSQQGDYFYVNLRTERGSEQTFIVDNDICFLARHREDVLTIQFDEVERYFPEGGGYYPANVIQSISTSSSQKHWSRNNNVSPALAQWRECSRDLSTLSDDQH